MDRFEWNCSSFLFCECLLSLGLHLAIFWEKLVFIRLLYGNKIRAVSPYGKIFSETSVQFANDVEFSDPGKLFRRFFRLSVSTRRKGGASREMLTECELRKWSLPNPSTVKIKRFKPATTEISKWIRRRLNDVNFQVSKMKSEKNKVNWMIFIRYFCYFHEQGRFDHS